MSERCIVPGCNKTCGHVDIASEIKTQIPQQVQVDSSYKNIRTSGQNGKSRIIYKKWTPKTGHEIVCGEHFIST